MAGSDGAILLTTARWGGQADADSPQVYLHEVAKNGELPQLVRVVKGSYLGLGAQSLANNPSLSSTALIASAGLSLRLAVQCLKFKDNHKTVNVGPKLAIPETFDGFFEILNEDGRAVRCIESVAELARKAPDSCLARQSAKVYWVPADSVQPPDTCITERSRSLVCGELLVLVGQVLSNGRYLRCLDSRGDHVYLPMELRAKFSAVAKEDHQQSISGVHRIRSLLKKRLPLTVRMVSGTPPAGLKIGQQFCHEMRLLASFREEMIVALPLGAMNCNGSAKGSTNNDIVIIPPSVSLKLQLPVNRQSLKSSKEFLRMTERCLHQYGLISDRIQVYDAHFSKNLRFDGQHWKVPVPLLLAPLRRSTSDLIQSFTGKSKESASSVPTTPVSPLPEEETEGVAISEDIIPEYDEIDQIYDYIRGFAPLPKSVTNGASVPNKSPYRKNNEGGINVNHRRNLYNRVISKPTNKPIPPPLETLPDRVKQDDASQQQKAVDRQRSVSPPPLSKPRMYRQRTSTGMPAQRLYSKNPLRSSMSPAESNQSLTPSPLFNIRYKSMTNLLAASPADSDTLGSSQSGGRCSGGSAGSAAVRTAYARPTPVQHHHQHRLFHLHRPRSLTDLLWGRQPGHQTPVKIQLHPTVVADVIPRPSSRNGRRLSTSNLLLNGSPSGGGVTSSSGNKKHTIFYRL